MIKALSATKRPAVTITVMDGTKQYQIFLNEQEVTMTTPDMDGEEHSETQYQYDFNEFRTDALSEDEVKAHPEKYLNYTPIASLPEPEKQESIDATIKALQDAQEETAQAVQDMLAMQMEAKEA